MTIGRARNFLARGPISVRLQQKRGNVMSQRWIAIAFVFVVGCGSAPRPDDPNAPLAAEDAAPPVAAADAAPPPAVDAGAPPLPVEHQACTDGWTCADALTCVVDDPTSPTRGTCKRICTRDGDCPSGEACAFGALASSEGVCAQVRREGQSCDDLFSGARTCSAEAGATAIPVCAGGSCALLCGYQGQSFTCPTSERCVASSMAGVSVCAGGGGGPSCVGTATASGTVNGVTPSVHVGAAVLDSGNGGLDLALTPRALLAAGDVMVELLFVPIMGQTSYANSPLGGCAVLRQTGGGWTVIDKTQLCDIELTTLQMASAPGVCDGLLVGRFAGVFSGNATLAGTFSIPLSVVWSQIRMPSCLPTDSPCTSNAQCCSSSCAPALGTCY
jgi:hypothetical protein